MKEQIKAVKFVNFTETPFTWSFDSIPYTFNPNEPIYLESYKAEHFAKHLVDRELNRLNQPTSMKALREELTRKCFPSTETVTPEVMLNINEEKKAKKGKKKVEEFPELNAEIQ